MKSEINLLKHHIGQAGIKYSPWPIHSTMNYDSLIKYLESTPNVNGSFGILLKYCDSIQTTSYANSV